MADDVDDLMTRLREAVGTQEVGMGMQMGDNDVLRVRLHRPPGNRMSWAMLQALGRVGAELQRPGDARCVLVFHSGPDFCQGADFGDTGLATRMAAGEESRLHVARVGQAMIRDWALCPIPVVIAAQGKCIGGGAGLWFAGDVRVSGHGSTLCFPEVDRGMHLSWGLVPVVEHEVGPAWARRLALLGDTLAVEDLCGLGISTLVRPDEVMRHADAVAASLAAKAPLAVRSILEVGNRALRSRLEVAHDDAEVFAKTVGSQDFSEALTAFFEQRPGVYQGR